MGYETRMYIGLLHSPQRHKTGRYVQKLAMLEMGRAFDNTFIDESDKAIEVFIYADNQKEDTIKTDAYGSKLYAIDPFKVLDRLVHLRYTASPLEYVALQLLPALIKGYKNAGLVCVLYGH